MPHSRVKNHLSVVQHALICECQQCRAHAGPCKKHSSPRFQMEGISQHQELLQHFVKEQLLGFIPAFFTQCELTSLASTLCGFLMH